MILSLLYTFDGLVALSSATNTTCPEPNAQFQALGFTVSPDCALLQSFAPDLTAESSNLNYVVGTPAQSLKMTSSCSTTFSLMSSDQHAVLLQDSGGRLVSASRAAGQELECLMLHFTASGQLVDSVGRQAGIDSNGLLQFNYENASVIGIITQGLETKDGSDADNPEAPSALTYNAESQWCTTEQDGHLQFFTGSSANRICNSTYLLSSKGDCSGRATKSCGNVIRYSVDNNLGPSLSQLFAVPLNGSFAGTIATNTTLEDSTQTAMPLVSSTLCSYATTAKLVDRMSATASASVYTSLSEGESFKNDLGASNSNSAARSCKVAALLLWSACMVLVMC